MTFKIKRTWNNSKGLRRWFSYDECKEMCGDGYYYRAVTLFGISAILFDV